MFSPPFFRPKSVIDLWDSYFEQKPKRENRTKNDLEPKPKEKNATPNDFESKPKKRNDTRIDFEQRSEKENRIKHDIEPKRKGEDYAKNSSLPNDNKNEIKSTKNISESAKLKVSNLDYGVTLDDITELFSEFGKLKNVFFWKVEAGQFKKANIFFEKRSDAIR